MADGLVWNQRRSCRIALAMPTLIPLSMPAGPVLSYLPVKGFLAVGCNDLCIDGLSGLASGDSIEELK